MTSDDHRRRAGAVARRLADAYPDARCELDYGDPWQLLVATVLSAQCTDVRVNRTTPAVFARWPGPAELAAASPAELEELIRPTGLHRSKARSLIETARIVTEVHGGRVPHRKAELVDLPGVGPKTAKVILGEAFGIPAGVAVDTHVRRVTRRIGLTEADHPEKVAAELEGLLPRDAWVRFSLRTILHGRRVCTARRPRCGDCVLAPECEQVGV
jgi:endonuclease-3